MQKKKDVMKMNVEIDLVRNDKREKYNYNEIIILKEICELSLARLSFFSIKIHRKIASLFTHKFKGIW